MTTRTFTGLAMLMGALAASAASAEPALRSGQSAMTNDLMVQCLDDRVRVISSYEPHGLPVRRRRGPLESSSVDCRLADGTPVRVKSGQRGQPMPYGQCGGAPGEMLSVWIARRRVLSQFEYSSFCQSESMRSLEIRRASATICIPVAGDDAHPAESFVALRARGLDGSGCAALPLARGAPVDTQEYPATGAEPPPVDSLVLEARPAMREACRALLPAIDGQDPQVPERLPQPAWQQRRVDTAQPDLLAVGFNATTLSTNGTVDTASFDLENSGTPRQVYRQEATNLWFDGSALAIDAPGVLTTPYDAHNLAATLRKGIHVWTYDHAQVFFDHGRTYVLLNPVSHLGDSRVVALHGQREETVCTFRRVQDRF